MLSNLKRKLTLLSGISISIIVTLVIILIFSFFIILDIQHNENLFNNNVNTLINDIHNSSTLNSNQLNEMENSNNIVIHIEVEGHPFSYKGCLSTPTDRNVLIEAAKQAAINEGLNFNSNPINPSIKKSSIIKLNVNDGENYQSISVIIPYGNSWRTITVIQWIPNRNSYWITIGFIFFIIDLMTCISIFILSNIFIGKALKPVEENNQRQIEFIAAASHELRSPLTVIKASISSIKSDALCINDYIPHIESECNRMSRLISDMLLLATADAKTWTLKKESVDMDTFLIETYDLFCPVALSKNMILNLKLPDEPLNNIDADKERLQQILTIFIDNATEYSPPNTNITIKAYNGTDSVFLEISDQGIGISDEQKKLIFNRFYRGDKSRTSKKHFGLGLNIAKELIDLHHGKLSVKDTPGGGATFIIELPC